MWTPDAWKVYKISGKDLPDILAACKSLDEAFTLAKQRDSKYSTGQMIRVISATCKECKYLSEHGCINSDISTSDKIYYYAYKHVDCPYFEPEHIGIL